MQLNIMMRTTWVVFEQLCREINVVMRRQQSGRTCSLSVFGALQLNSDLPSVLWGFQEEGVDEGDGVGLDLLVGPEEGGKHSNSQLEALCSTRTNHRA